MTALPHIPRRDDDPRADASVVVTFTPRGQRALDELAAVITHQMARTPDGIAHTLAMVYRTPLDDLVGAFEAIAGRLADERTGP